MPKIKRKETLPPIIRAFRMLGVDCEAKSGEEYVSDCFVCGKENKLYINSKTTKYQCKVCGLSGNDATLSKQFYENCCVLCTEVTSLNLKNELLSIQEEKGIASLETLANWGFAYNPLSHKWIVPGFNLQKEIRQIYTYTWVEEKLRFICLPGDIRHQLMLPKDYADNRKADLYICEGFWDGVSLSQALQVSTRNRKGVIQPYVEGGKDQCLLASSNILVVPGSNVFRSDWASLCHGKNVYVLFDNDHPREERGKIIDGAALSGVKRVARTIGLGKAKQVQCLWWGTNGSYHNPNLNHGYDVRDLLTTKDPSKIWSKAKQLFKKLAEVPSEFYEGEQEVLVECRSWKELNQEWEKALRWTEGLEGALACMLACIVSTRLAGDQLWMKIVGPPSCGKSTLCEAISINKTHVEAKSTIRGFHSGYRTNVNDDSEDNSLLSRLRNKCLVTKDGDTLLRAPNIEQILSEARDIYDTTSRTHYRNKVSKDYSGLRMTWILCGTSSIRYIDSSDLGERFLDYVIMEGVSEDLEDSILEMVVDRVRGTISEDGENREGTSYQQFLAMSKTGGYIDYLISIAKERLSHITKSNNRWAELHCMSLGKFVAYMRTKPNDNADKFEREFSSRLVSQLMRLAYCLSVVLGKFEIDEDVMTLVTKVALDTSRGIVFEVTNIIYDHGEEGCTLEWLQGFLESRVAEWRRYIRLLKEVGIIEKVENQKRGRVRDRIRYRITKRVQQLYSEVLGNASSKR